MIKQLGFVTEIHGETPDEGRRCVFATNDVKVQTLYVENVSYDEAVAIVAWFDNKTSEDLVTVSSRAIGDADYTEADPKPVLAVGPESKAGRSRSKADQKVGCTTGISETTPYDETEADPEPKAKKTRGSAKRKKKSKGSEKAKKATDIDPSDAAERLRNETSEKLDKTPPNGVPEELLEVNQIKQVVLYFVNLGMGPDDIDEVTETCEVWKESIPALARVKANLRDRLHRLLTIHG